MGEDKCTHNNVKRTQRSRFHIVDVRGRVAHCDSYECLWCGAKGSKEYTSPTEITWEEEE